MPTIAKTHARRAGLFAILLVTAALCGSSPAALAVEKAPEAGPPLAVSKTLMLTPKGGRNPTLAWERRSGAVYLAWAQEVPGTAQKDKDGKKVDPRLEVRVARSDDGGRSFGPSVVASSPESRVESHTVSPTQVAMPGTAPDVAAEGETAIVTWGTQGQGDQETGGGINTRVISLPETP